MTFDKISNCSVDDAHGWEDRCFLTFDLDWACDDVLSDTVDLVEAAGVAATWFVTHDTPLLRRLRANPSFELGIHPNFNFLLEGSGQDRNAAEVLDRILRVVPEATAVRSHSMVQSSRLQQLFRDRGLTHDCNHFIPEQSGMPLRPWVLWNGLVKVPHFWEDDAAALYEKNAPVAELVRRPGLKVFAFHPIHVFLNMEDLGRYERSRPLHRAPEELLRCRHVGEGTRTVLEALLRLASRNALAEDKR